MPLTPFIGLSVLAHMAIIILRRVFRIPIGERAIASHNSLFKTGIGYLIIVIVFGFVLSSAVTLVRASITDSHSTLHFLEKYLAPTPAIATESQDYMCQQSISTVFPLTINIADTRVRIERVNATPLKIVQSS